MLGCGLDASFFLAACACHEHSSSLTDVAPPPHFFQPTTDCIEKNTKVLKAKEELGNAGSVLQNADLKLKLKLFGLSCTKK